MIGTSDQFCWLAEACKIHALEGLWIHGVTVSHASNAVHLRFGIKTKPWEYEKNGSGVPPVAVTTINTLPSF